MKPNHFILFFLTMLLLSCSDKSNSPEFMEEATGKYLYNLDETIEVYFEENELLMKWRGKDKIVPMNLGDKTFFIKEMNEKIQFLKNPTDNIQYISLIPKEKTELITYDFRKLDKDEDVPSTYLKNKEYDKALMSYLAIKEKDSSNVFINESNFNSLGYRQLREDNFNEAIEIFKINVALYPESDNVYDSLADAYKKSGDTINAIHNYKKAIAIDSGNRGAKRFIEKYDTK